MGVDIASRQALDQGIDARSRCSQPGAQVVAFGGDRGELLCELRVRLLQCFVAQKQPFYPVGEVF